MHNNSTHVVRAPRFRSISTKVILSLVLVVLFQGIVSITVVTWILSRTAASALEDQLARTAYLVDKYLNEQGHNLNLQAKILAGQEKLAGFSWAAPDPVVDSELAAMLEPLHLDAAFIAGPHLEILASAGNRESLDIAAQNGIILAALNEGGIILTGAVSKMQMWARYTVYRDGVLLGAVFACLNLNRSFLTGMEEASNAKILISLRKSIMVNGHLSDPVFLEYIRRSFADPGQAESGTIDNLVYRLTRFPGLNGLSAVYFVDTASARGLIVEYTVFSVLFLIVVLFMGVLMAIGLYRMSFQRPFARFQRAIRSISQGDLTYHAYESGADEFGALEREFETMTINLKKLEERLRISSRMAAVGEMAAGVAHQVRNPLGIMKVSAGILGEAFNDANDRDGKYRKLVGMISGEVDTLSEVITRFLDFTRPLQVHPEPTEVRGLLGRAIDLIDSERWPGVVARVDCPEELTADLDASLMLQVLTNLLVNAFEASSSGQTVELAAWRASDGSLRLRVRDEGGGMDDQVKAQVFHPFFTTKHSGTGLGLAIAHRIVEAHGGSIELSTELKKGTTIEIVL